MLTEQEVNKIFSWLPYRDNWAVDRNQLDDNIGGYYGELIKEFKENNLFDTYYSQDGGLSNYLEFICYPTGHETYNDNAILVCVSLCSPIAAYGQTMFTKTTNSWGWGFIEPETIGLIRDHNLADIENEVIMILKKYQLILLDKEFVCRPLPAEVIEALKYENHNEGNQYLHGLFQAAD
jgi:hypothetical protein